MERPLAGLERCPLHGGCKCIISIVKSIGAYHLVRYEVGVRYWECPLLEVPLYTIYIEPVILYSE